MEHAVFFGFLVLAALVFALFEIQIEGRDGWAAKLPTWRVENRLTRLLTRKPLTGYHLYAQAFLLIVAHAPFGLGLAAWSLRGELRVLAFLLLFWVVEDFLWFLCNREFGLRRFKPQFIARHRDAWWWVAPRDYWVGAPIGLVLYALAA
jgi:hypothetical protein